MKNVLNLDFFIFSGMHHIIHDIISFNKVRITFLMTVRFNTNLVSITEKNIEQTIAKDNNFIRGLTKFLFDTYND